MCDICKPCCSFQLRMDLYTLRCLTLWNPISQLFACTSQSRVEPYQFSCSHAAEIVRVSRKNVILKGRCEYASCARYANLVVRFSHAWAGVRCVVLPCGILSVSCSLVQVSHVWNPISSVVPTQQKLDDFRKKT